MVRILSRLNIGGPAIHTILLTQRLQDEQFESFLLTGRESPGEGNMLALADEKQVQPLILPHLGRPIHLINDVLAGIEIWRTLRRIKPDIVHTHASKAGFLGRIAAILVGVPVRIHTFHGHVLQEYFGRLTSHLFVGLERFLSHWSDTIIGVSQEVCDQLKTMGIGSEKSIRHIPLGLELERFCHCETYRGQLRNELGIADDVSLVGIIARLVPIKGHRDFFLAAQAVHKQLPGKVKFLIAGDGELRDELTRQVHQLGLSDAVLFLGFRQDLERLYADLDVVALTSYNEGLPVALIEALAAGRPGVATRVGGVPELIQDGVTGFLVEKGDWAGLAEKILWLLKHPQQAQTMGEQGRNRVIPSLCIERLEQDIRSLYLELAKEKGLLE